MPLKVRSPTLNLIPHTLHVMQVVGLVPILSEQGSCHLGLLYLPCPELPLGSLTVQEPAVTNTDRSHKVSNKGRQSVMTPRGYTPITQYADGRRQGASIWVCHSN